MHEEVPWRCWDVTVTNGTCVAISHMPLLKLGGKHVKKRNIAEGAGNQHENCRCFNYGYSYWNWDNIMVDFHVGS